jgi:hypothetical protein
MPSPFNAIFEKLASPSIAPIRKYWRRWEVIRRRDELIAERRIRNADAGEHFNQEGDRFWTEAV